MKKFIFFILSAFLLMSCGDEIPQPNKTVRSGRTVLAYFVANNNLDNFIMDNVMGMYEGLSNMKDTSSLVIFYKPLIVNKPESGLVSASSYFAAPTILKFETDGHGRINNQPALLGADLKKENIIAQAKILKTLPNDLNSLDPEQMETIFRFMIEDTPSKSYGLVFGSHATSWMPKDNASRSFGKDGNYQIDIPEMSMALSKVFSRENLDFILWDACMMGTAEVAHQFKDVTNFMLGSIMESPISGFPYKAIMNFLYQEDIPFQDICSNTIKFFEKSGWGTVAAIDCRQTEQLATFIRSNRDLFADEALQTKMKTVQQYGAKTYAYNFSGFSYDLMDTFNHLELPAVPDELTVIMKQLVVGMECLEGPEYEFNGVVLDKERYSGIGMYIPTLNLDDKWNEYYKNLTWYKAAGWDELMN